MTDDEKDLWYKYDKDIMMCTVENIFLGKNFRRKCLETRTKDEEFINLYDRFITYTCVVDKLCENKSVMEALTDLIE